MDRQEISISSWKIQIQRTCDIICGLEVFFFEQLDNFNFNFNFLKFEREMNPIPLSRAKGLPTELQLFFLYERRSIFYIVKNTYAQVRLKTKNQEGENVCYESYKSSKKKIVIWTEFTVNNRGFFQFFVHNECLHNKTGTFCPVFRSINCFFFFNFVCFLSYDKQNLQNLRFDWTMTLPCRLKNVTLIYN